MDTVDRRLADAQRWVLAATTLLSALAIWRPLPDPFMLPKLTVIVLGVVVLLGVAAVRALRAAQVTVPVGLTLWTAGAFAAALVLATLTAANVALAFVGNHSRYGGLLSYASYLVVFLVAARLFATSSTRPVVLSLLGAMAGVATYGVLQIAGLDPYEWVAARDRTIFSTMGNTNFAGAYVALVLPVAAAVVLLPGWSRGGRIAAAVIALGSAAYMLATAASQAVLAAVAGLLVVGIAWMLAARHSTARSKAHPRPRWQRWVAGAGVLVVLVLGGLLGSRVAADAADSFVERLQFWQAAVSIAVDHPIVGTGLDSFRDQFPRYRPAAHAVERDYQITDSAHNAVLGMLSNGGVLLALTYLALVGYTGWALLRGLRTVAGERVLPLAAFGGMWLAYQVQSLVSVDVPPLAFLHFLSAGMIVALATTPTTRSWALPLPRARHDRFLPRTGATGRPVAAALLAVVLLLGVSAAWAGMRPLRADLAAAGSRGLQEGRGLPGLDRAVMLAPWEAEYRLLQAQSRLDAGDRQGAYEAAAAAAELRRGSSKLAVGNVDLALRLEDDAAARRWMELALERDPNNPVVLERGAKFFRDVGDLARAEDLERHLDELRTRYGGE